MKVGAKIEGVEGLIAGFTKYGVESRKAVKRAVDRTALAVETDAKGKLKADGHIITGRLWASIHRERQEGENFSYNDKGKRQFDGSLGETIAKDEAIVGTNVEYAPYIEFGTKYFSGDSFLGFAALKQEKLLTERVTQELNKIKI